MIRLVKAVLHCRFILHIGILVVQVSCLVRAAPPSFVDLFSMTSLIYVCKLGVS